MGVWFLPTCFFFRFDSFVILFTWCRQRSRLKRQQRLREQERATPVVRRIRVGRSIQNGVRVVSNPCMLFFSVFSYLKKKIHLAKERFKNPLKSHSPQLFRHSSLGLFWKNRIICSSQQHTTRNKKELSIISRSDETMMMMCVNCCVIHFSTFR